MTKQKILPYLIFIVLGIIVFEYIRAEVNIDKTSEQSDKKIDMSNNNATIAFYNVENLFDIYNDPHTADNEFTPNGDLSWDKTRYTDKLSKIADVIADLNPSNAPAVLGFAEVENYDVLKDLIHTGALNKQPYQIIHKDNHDKRGIDVAAIYREDLFNLKNSYFYPVTLPGEGEPTTRDILHLEGEFGNHELVHIFYTHWPSRRKGTKETAHKRIAVAKTLRTHIDAVLGQDPKANIFILGDFNDEPSDKSLSQYLVKSDFYNLSQKFENTVNGTVNHQGDWLVFDQIIISKHLLNDKQFNISKNDIHIHQNSDVTFTHRDGNQTPSRTYGGRKYYGGYSDHYAVYLNLKLH